MATIKTSGIVIKKLNLGEADRILTILTRDRGKIRVLAKGVRRPKAKLTGFADMFHYNDFILAEGRNWDIVTAATTVERFLREDTSLEQIGLMYYACELVDKLIEETQMVKGSFELLRETLHYIKNHPETIVARSYFEMKLLMMLGFSPILEQCAVSRQPIREAETIYFSCRLGGAINESARTQDELARAITPITLKWLRLLQRYPLEAIEKIKVDEQTLKQAAGVLSDFVEYATEVRARSLTVMGELEN